MAIAVVAAFVMGTLVAGNVAEAGNPVKSLENYDKQLDRTAAKLTGTVDGIGDGPFTPEEANLLLPRLVNIFLSADEIRGTAQNAVNTILVGTTP